MFERLDDWIVTHYGLGVSWVVWCLCALFAAAGFAIGGRGVSDSAAWLVFIAVMFSIYSALSVIAALLAYASWKFGMWDDRRTRGERIRDRQ